MERYKRQLELIGKRGQNKLAKARVLIVGAGGLGNICAKYLASSGIGEITICDSDYVEVSNLNRQILFNGELVDMNKAEALCSTLAKINPDVLYTYVKKPIQDLQMCYLFDIIIDCTDNMKASYYIEKQALKNKTPLVFAKTSKWFGVVTVIRDTPYLKKNYPTKQLNKDHSVFPSIGGVVGSFQASMALKLILGKKVSDKVYHFDILNDRFIEFNKG